MGFLRGPLLFSTAMKIVSLSMILTSKVSSGLRSALVSTISCTSSSMATLAAIPQSSSHALTKGFISVRNCRAPSMVYGIEKVVAGFDGTVFCRVRPFCS